eukprot:gene4848-3474_t
MSLWYDSNQHRTNDTACGISTPDKGIQPPFTLRCNVPNEILEIQLNSVAKTLFSAPSFLVSKGHRCTRNPNFVTMSETNSMASSQRTISSSRSRLGVRLFATSIPIFPIFLALESGFHKIWSYAGLIIQFVQFLGFVLNPHLQHGETLHYVSYFVYAFHLPFWDATWAKLSWVGYVVMWAFGVLYVLLYVVILAIILITRRPPMRRTKLFVYLRLCIHGASTIFFIPLAQSFFSQMVCYKEHLWTFPTTKCFSTSTSPVFVVSLISFVLLALTAYMAESTLFLEGYNSPHPLARKHYVNDMYFVTWKILSVMLFHLFLSNSTREALTYMWLPMYIALSAGIMTATYVIFLPFIHQTTNRMFTIAFLIVSIAGVVVFFSCQGGVERRQADLYEESMLAKMDVDGLLLLTLGSLMVVVGWLLGDFRINRELLDFLPRVTDAAAPFPERYTLIYPKGLPEYDMAYQSTMDLCNDVADGAIGEGHALVSLEFPYLTRIYFVSDVEVSTRFIPLLEKITGHYPTKQMLHLATRIYVKALYRFPDSVSVIVSFAAMISEYTSKTSVALIQCERTNAIASSIPSRYRAYRLLSYLKMQVGMRDGAYQHRCEEAKRAHKDILIRLHQFWHKLVSQHDRSQLQSSFSAIAQRRKATNEMFLAALQHQNCDRELLLKYADFLEQVMMEPSTADKLRHSALQEMERQNSVRGARSLQWSAPQHSYAELVKKNRGTVLNNNIFCGLRIDLHTLWKILNLVLLLCTAAAFLIVVLFTHNWVDATMQCVETSATARTLRMQGDLVAMQFWTTQQLFEDSGTRLHAISAISQDMLYIHDYLTGGLPRASSTSREDFFIRRLVVDSFYSGSDIQHITNSFLSLGFHYATHLNDIAGVIARSNLKSSSTQETTFTEVAAVKASLFDQWHTSVQRNILLMYCFIYAVGLLGLSMFMQLSSMMSPVEKLKSTIITLVTLIPPKKIHEIADVAKKKVEKFDATQGDDDEKLQEVEVGDPREEEHEEDEEEEAGTDAAGSRAAGELLSEEDAKGEKNTGLSDDDEDKHSPRDNESKPLLRRSEKKKHTSKSTNAGDSGEVEEEVSSARTFYSSARSVEVLIYCVVTGLLIASVVMSVWSVPENTKELSVSNVAERIRLYKDSQNKIYLTTMAVCSFFASGTTEAYLALFDYWEKFRRVIPSILSYGPLEAEVESLIMVANYLDANQALVPSVTSFYSTPSSTTSQFDPADPTKDLSNAVGNQALGVVVGLASDETLNNPPLYQMLNNLINTTNSAVRAATRDKDQCISGLQRKRLIMSVTCCEAVAAVLIIITCVILVCRYGTDINRVVAAFLAISLAFSIAGCLFGAFSFMNLVKLEDNCWKYISAQKLQSKSIQYCITPLVYASIYVLQVGTPSLLVAMYYFDYIFDNPWESYRDSLPEERRAEFSNIMEHLRMFEKIALTMVGKINGQTLIELNGFTWDFDKEPDAMTVRVDYPNDPLRYTTTAQDEALPDVQLHLKAKDVLSNKRIHDMLNRMWEMVEDEFRRYTELFHDTAKSKSKTIQVLMFLCIACSVLSMVTFIAFLFVQLQVHLSSFYGANSLLKRPKNQTFAATRLRVLMLILFLTLTAIFAVCIYSRSYHSSLANQLDLLNARGYLVASSMISVELWDSGNIPQPSMQSQIEFYYAQLDWIRMEISFGENNIFNTFSELDNYLLGQNVQLSEQFRYGFDDMVLTDDKFNSTDYTFSKGLENALAMWMQEILELARYPTYTSTKILLASMRDSVMQLLRGLDEACHILYNLSSSSTDKFLIVQVVLVILFMILTVVTFPVLLIPEARHYAIEEAGYRMLVKLIPEDVKESIPAMRSFIAHGLDEQIDASSATDEIGIPTIAINTKGVVTHFNRAAEEVFGYASAEVLGNNVSILMPTRIAKLHSSFLEKYDEAKPVNRQIFRERELQGRRKNNEHFTMRLSVNEVRLRDGTRSFIGFALDISDTVEKSRNEQLSRFVQEYMTLPMIAIDSLGTVLRFNRAAEECFGRTSAEVIESNVKILMPEDIANRHDTYLATYLRTKKKHAIDNITRSRAIRKNGTEFPVELMIKAISDTNDVSTYIGFARDLSGDQELEMAIAITDTILKTSVTPIICTDMYGRIVSFSKAAEKTFGYTAKEVLDHNCKVLMPETVADRHDEYMENYRTTWSKRASAIVDRTVIGRHKDGRVIPLYASLHEVKTSSANNTALVGFFRELAETRDLENNLSLEQIAAENHRTPLVVASSKGIITQANRAALLEFGYTLEELLGSNLGILMPLHIAEKHDSYLSRYAETGVGSVVNNTRKFQGKRKNGSLFTVELRVREVRDDDNEPSYIGFLRNVDKEVRMSRQEAINEVILSHPNMPIVAVDINGKVFECNEAAERLLRYRSGELVGENIETFLPNPALSQGERTGFTLPVDKMVACDAITFDATTIPVQAMVKVVHTKPPYYLVLIRDTCEDNAVAVKGMRNTQIAEFSPIPMLEFDLAGNITSFNSAAERQFLWKREDAIGKHFQCFIKDSEVVSDILKAKDVPEFTEDYGTARIYQTQAKTKNGKVFPVELAVNEVEITLDVEKRTKAFIAYLTDLSEGMQQQAAQRVSRAHLDLNPQPIITISRFGMIISCNVAFAMLFRYPSAKHLIGQNVSILMPPDVGEQHDGYLVAYAKTRIKRKIGKTSSVTAKRFDGTLFPASLTIHEIKDESGQEETIFMGTMTDESVGLELADAKCFTDAIFTLCPQPLFVFDTKGVIEEVNEAACNMFLYPDRQTLVSIPVKKLLPDLCTEAGDIKPRFSDTTNPLVHHKRMVTAMRADGSSFDAEVVFTVIGVKESVYIVACLTDMTQTNVVLAQKKLNMTIADHSPVPVIIVGPNGVIKLFSAAAEKFYGYSSEEAVGASMRIIMTAEEAAEHERIMRHYHETGDDSKVGANTERQARLKSGEVVPITLLTREIPASNGMKADFVGYVTDRSSKFTLERAANLAQTVEQSMPIPFVIASGTGIVMDLNGPAETFFGYKNTELAGQSISIIVSTRIPEADRPITMHAVPVVTRFGEVKETDVAICPLVDPKNLNSTLTRVGIMFGDRSVNNMFLRAKQRSDRLMAFIKDAVVCADPQTGNIICINDAAQKLLKCDEIISLNGKPLGTIIPDADAAQTILSSAPRGAAGQMDAAVAAFLGDTKEEIGTKVMTCEGTIFSASITIQAYTEEVLFRIQDMGELHYEYLSKAFLNGLENLVLDPFLIVNEEDDIVFFSKNAQTLLEYEEDDTITSQRLLDGGFISLFDRCGDKKEGTLSMDMSSHTPFAVSLGDQSLGMNTNTLQMESGSDNRFYTMRGEIRAMNAAMPNKSAIALGSGKVRYFDLRFSEIRPPVVSLKETQRRYVIVFLGDEDERERERTSLEVMQCMMENSPSAVCVIDAIGTILQFNAAAERMFRFERSQLIGKNVKLLMPQRFATRHDTYLQTYLRTRERRVIGSTREVTGERKDGEQFQLNLSMNEIIDEGKPVIGLPPLNYDSAFRCCTKTVESNDFSVVAYSLHLWVFSSPDPARRFLIHCFIRLRNSHNKSRRRNYNLPEGTFLVFLFFFQRLGNFIHRLSTDRKRNEADWRHDIPVHQLALNGCAGCIPFLLPGTEGEKSNFWFDTFFFSLSGRVFVQ